MLTTFEIIKLVRKVTHTPVTEVSTPDLFGLNQIVKFTRMVEAKEREACAKVCEEQYEYYGHNHVFAKAIRARGEV